MELYAIGTLVGLGLFIVSLIDEKPFWATISFIMFIGCGIGFSIGLKII